MDLSDLTPQQAHDVAQRLRPTLGYLVRLTNRMQQAGWRADDSAYAAAWRARDALHELTVHLHYRTRGLHPVHNTPPPPPPPRPWEPGGSGRDGA